LHQPTSGRVLIDGQPLTRELIPSWQATIGYVPQELFLIDDTITRNIALGVPDKEIDNARLKEVCAMAQILDFIETDSDDFRLRWESAVVRGPAPAPGLARALSSVFPTSPRRSD
jgi:ABC-type multidrug transport system fused ATPase/permease subunit